MNLNELNKYYFHDSSIIELKKQNDNINLKIDYCLFMQEDYIEGTQENCVLELSFKNATSNLNTIEDNTILNTIIRENTITFNLELDETEDNIQLIITAQSVDISKV